MKFTLKMTRPHYACWEAEVASMLREKRMAKRYGLLEKELRTATQRKIARAINPYRIWVKTKPAEIEIRTLKDLKKIEDDFKSELIINFEERLIEIYNDSRE